MRELAERIAAITVDYHCDIEDEFQMTPDHILSWVNQFDQEDRVFILEELIHLLNQGIYISKSRAKILLDELIKKLSVFFKCSSVEQFLNETHFLNLQPEGKSQSILLGLLDEILKEKYGKSLNMCGSLGIKNYIYIDDVLGTGKTFINNITNWLNTANLLNDLKNKKIFFFAYFFCSHSWGRNHARNQLKRTYSDESYFSNSSKFVIRSNYIIENILLDNKPRLNLLYPQNNNVHFNQYLANIVGIDPQISFRPINLPCEETFFSSSENRNRLESIFLAKGIGIIGRIRDEQKRINHRPLGKTYPYYKTFGTGTMFFTWTNISNTCPIVLWWNNPAHNWKGLFPLNKRGI